MTVEQLAVLLLAAAFLTGVRSTYRLWVKFRAVGKLLHPDGNAIGLIFFLIALLLTVTAGFFGFISARHLLGFESLPGAALIETLIGAAVLFVPWFLDYAVDRIGRP